ncbi:MAG: AAA family ATPase, partial [Myxococcales bacterium]|nr:AAA family ATPase [Myxococcales bacterium]
AQRGHVITLREMRYVDFARIETLEKQIAARFEAVSRETGKFLLGKSALEPLIAELTLTIGKVPGCQKSTELQPLRKKVDATADGLGALSEVFGNLPIADPTQRTQILSHIGDVFAQVNRTKAALEGRRKELAASEGRAEFSAQFALLGQSVASAIASCDTPERCDEQLSRVMVQLEELEGKFSELDEFLGQLTEKREDVADAFGARRQQLLDERQRRIDNVSSALDRILEGVGRRARSMKSTEELNAYFASDAMIEKAQSLAADLAKLGDTVKSDAFIAKLKSARQDSLRGLRDKLELFDGGTDLVRFGQHRFSVNTQPLELTMVPRGDGLALHLTGTNYFAPLEDRAFLETQRFWRRDLPSESPEIYRSEYLAYTILLAAERGDSGQSFALLREKIRNGELLRLVEDVAQKRYDEGYDRGVHDQDAARLLEKYVELYDAAGLMRYPAGARALATVFYAHGGEAKALFELRARSLGRLRDGLGDGAALAALAGEIAKAIASFIAAQSLEGNFAAEHAPAAAAYLVEELAKDPPRFITSHDAEEITRALLEVLDRSGRRSAFEQDLRGLDGRLREQLTLARAWVDAFVTSRPELAKHAHLAVEAAVLLCRLAIDRHSSAALAALELQGLIGQHGRVSGGKLELRIDEILGRLGDYHAREVPQYRAYRKLRHELLEREREGLRLGEYVPKVMTAFVRNKLITEVYLPLIGNNLAKQIGAAGAAKRTDLMGLLLLISPPGYGKTTLMEYVASRLGLVFVKVNGPALGHEVSSLDPANAPNATARQEVEKINFAFEMGDNVMLYLDDIQHTNPELLQKFISLCDAQRRVEGVWRGKTQTYDFRGRKFCVVMAGNPYTESGEKFRIPDMLANRADTYNLGDVLSGKEDAFALSYIENTLTSNPALQPLATREQADVYKLVRMARGEEVATSELSYGYSGVELEEILSVIRHLFRVQKTLGAVNMAYIASASQDERFRTEPRFLLQGSYRNMNRMAEKIAAAMNEAEVDQLVTDHYASESQNLTTGAEANLLKLAELRGRLEGEAKQRWLDIKSEYVRQKRMGGSGDDPVSRVTGTLSGLSADLAGIKDVLAAGSNQGLDQRLDLLATRLGELAGIKDVLAAGSHQGLDQRLDLLGARLGERLGDIHGALSNVAAAAATSATAAATAQTAAAARPRPDSEDDEPASADGDKNPRVARAAKLAGRQQWMKPYLLRLEAALEALSHPKLEVELKAPDDIRMLLLQQQELIERALIPMVNAATARNGDNDAVLQALSEVRALLTPMRGRK